MKKFMRDEGVCKGQRKHIQGKEERRERREGEDMRRYTGGRARLRVRRKETRRRREERRGDAKRPCHVCLPCHHVYLMPQARVRG